MSLLDDPRIYRVLGANAVSSIGSGVTMIAVPWLIVNRPGGPQIFGYAMSAMTLVLVIFLPFYGWLVDRSSRKTVLLAGELFGLFSGALFVALGVAAGNFETWHLVGIQSAGMLYYTLHYPALFAFNQEVFAREQYGQLASYVEIQGQSASMLSGAIGALVLEKLPLEWILGVSTLTYFGSWWLLRSIPYTRDPQRVPATTSVWAQITEGYHYLVARPRFALFLVCAFMPFVGIMIGNYLFPIYTAETLRAPGWVFGAGEMAFAIGAIAAGFFTPGVTRDLGPKRTILLGVGLAGLSALTFALVPVVAIYLLGNVTLGYGNASSRVARSTIMLETVPNALIGRVNVLFNLFERIARTVVIAALTAQVAVYGASLGFAFIALLLGMAWVGALFGRAETER